MADHQYAATGFAGNGMTFGTLGAMMIADGSLAGVIRGPSCSIPAGPRSARVCGEYIKENKDYPYYLVRDRFAGTEGSPYGR